MIEIIIYIITNRINGKRYVGQTVRELKERFGEHKRKQSLLSHAIRKYGEENFNIEVVDSAETVDDLNQKEIAWIKKINCIEPFGYNLCDGGGNTK